MTARRMNGSRYRVVFTSAMGRNWFDYTSERKARDEYRAARRGMWGDQTRLLRQDGDTFVQVLP